MGQALRAAVARQRMLLRGRLGSPLKRLADDCRAVWPERAALEHRLTAGLAALPSCKDLYVLDNRAQQITSNASPRGLLPEHFGRDRTGHVPTWPRRSPGNASPCPTHTSAAMHGVRH